MSSSSPPRSRFALERATLRRAMRFSVFEGMLYALMVGMAETYFVADAVRMHATPLEVGLVAALPLCVGGFGAAFGVGFLERLKSRKLLCVTCVVVQALVLMGLIAAQALGFSNPLELILGVCLYQVCGQLGGTTWSSWYGDLVPSPLRGRYFSHRTRLVHLTTFVGIAIAGTLLHTLEPQGRPELTEVSGGTGFMVIFGLAALARLCSAVILAVSPEPVFHDHHDSRDMLVFFKTEGGRHVARILLFAACVNFAVYLGSPYFAEYMLEDIQLDYFSFMLATATVMVSKFLFLPAFGRSVDRHGAAPVFRLAVFLVALTPLPWLFFKSFGVILFAQALSGFAWAAHEISFFTLLLETSDRKSRARIYSLQSVLNGSTQFLGSVLGAGALHRLGGDYLSLFWITTAARFLCAFSVAVVLAKIPSRSPISRGKLFLSAIGFRINTGIALQPEEGPEDTPAP